VPADEKTRFPNILTLQLEKVQDLRYGENPHQQAAFYREFGRREPCVAHARQLQGKEMSFNNFLDANSALELAKEYDQTAAIIVKHNNPCGVATAATPVRPTVKRGLRPGRGWRDRLNRMVDLIRQKNSRPHSSKWWSARVRA
jgi:phosphoribosylaminoimidazolecarboxamide formyltransferase/IMP cyclohydrolase